jgi:hypothetical protein
MIERALSGETVKVDGLRTLGYEVLEGFLDAACVGAVRREVDIALQAPPMPGCERPHNRLAALRWHDPIVRIILNDSERCEALERRITAEDLRWISGWLRVRQGRR